jgi:UDP-glucose 4-epimerase
LDALVNEGHDVRCLDVPTKRNQRAAKRILRRYRSRVDIVWGDLRRREDVAMAMARQEAIVHLAFIIPKQSCSDCDIEATPDRARAINVGGTRHLIEEARKLPVAPRFVFASSVAVYGLTAHLAPPRRATDPVHPVDAYGRHKVTCERLLRGSGLPWTILRLGAALPLRITNLGAMFDVPLDTRMEFVDPRDAALAFARAVGERATLGKTLLVGGGERCQHVFRDMVRIILDAAGVGMLCADAFGSHPFYTDWLDTIESQRLLRYQRHDLHDYARAMRRQLGPAWMLARAFRPLVQRWLLSKSPYLPQAEDRHVLVTPAQPTPRPVPTSSE